MRISITIPLALLALALTGTAAAQTSYRTVAQAKADVAKKVRGASDIYCFGRPEGGSIMLHGQRAYAVLKCYGERQSGMFSLTYTAGSGANSTISKLHTIA
jgi:hypothetical protein